MRLPITALLSTLVLSGCALPPIVTAVSLAANGVSYATTGKGTADHAISAVAGEDCAVLRAAKDEAICDPDGEVLFEVDIASTDNEDWHLDPETGVMGTGGTPRSASPFGLLAAGDPTSEPSKQAEAPAQVDKEESEALRKAVIPFAAEPLTPGFFAEARPEPKPQAPLFRVQQPQEQPTGWLQRLGQKTRSIFKE